MDEHIIGYDLDAFDQVTEAIRSFLNQYPALEDGDEITFASVSEDSGIGMFPTNSAAIRRERESITGHVEQECMYPFFILYRAGGLSQKRRINVKEWLDQFGRWLEKQPITINDEVYKVSDYPSLTGNRKIKSIQRQSPAYLDSINQNQSENWMISLNVLYINEFERN